MEEKLDAACGKLELRPLEEMIDESNIHGWLHEHVGITETRLAFLVTGLLKEDPARLAELKQAKQAAVRFGEKHAVQEGVGADEAVRIIGDTLLDGMPCDNVNQVLESGTDKAVWRKMQCVHSEYWEQFGGDPAVYDTLREDIINGMLIYSDLELCALGNNEYQISRKGQ